MTEQREQRQRYGNLDLAKEIAHQLGRVVPAGILEIEKPELAAAVQQRIVEAEIRRRQDAIGGAQFLLRRDPQRPALNQDLLLRRFPTRSQFLAREPPHVALQFRFRVESLQAADPPVDTGQVLADAETGLGGRRQGFGSRGSLRVLQLPAEPDRLPDQPIVDLRGRDNPAGDEFKQRQPLLRAAGQKLRRGADAVLPCKTAKGGLGSKAVPVVSRMREILLQQKRARGHVDAEHSVVGPASQRRDAARLASRCPAPVSAGRPQAVPRQERLQDRPGRLDRFSGCCWPVHEEHPGRRQRRAASQLVTRRNGTRPACRSQGSKSTRSTPAGKPDSSRNSGKSSM